MAEREWEPIRSFGIDNGELDGIRPNEIFVLGYELALIDEALKKPEGFEKPVHAYNRSRIEAECERLGRVFKFIWPQDDKSEEWLSLLVFPA